MRYRFATLDGVPILARMNPQLAEEEQISNRFKSDTWFEERMRGFLTGGYKAVLFERQSETVAYAPYTDHPDHSDTVYLQQIFVDRAHRRQEIGREVMRVLMEEIWPPDQRLTVGVLADSHAARAFYKDAGFREHSLELEISAFERGTRSRIS